MGSTHTQGSTDLERALGERAGVLRRSLRGLPAGMLEAMAQGLDAHGRDLVPGRLFLSRRRGGCLVGVMLRELDPERFEHGPVRFWLRERWRRGSRSYHGPLAANPRLKHLEWSFDDAVRRIRRRQPDLSPRVAARIVGRWVRTEVDRELRWRELRRSAAGAAAASVPVTPRGAGTAAA